MQLGVDKFAGCTARQCGSESPERRMRLEPHPGAYECDGRNEPSMRLVEFPVASLLTSHERMRYGNTGGSSPIKRPRLR